MSLYPFPIFFTPFFKLKVQIEYEDYAIVQKKNRNISTFTVESCVGRKSTSCKEKKRSNYLNMMLIKYWSGENAIH